MKLLVATLLFVSVSAVPSGLEAAGLLRWLGCHLGPGIHAYNGYDRHAPPLYYKYTPVKPDRVDHLPGQPSEFLAPPDQDLQPAAVWTYETDPITPWAASGHRISQPARYAAP